MPHRFNFCYRAFVMAVLGTAFVFSGCVLSSPAAHAQVAPAQIPHAHIYPEIASAEPDIRAGLAKARAEHKRVLLDFGGDWCGDCQVLNLYFHQAPNEKLLDDNFVRVNINIGREDANLDVAHRYGVPIHGVPALAVLDANGKVVVAQDKEFDDMRNMQASAVTEFLTKWKR